MAGTGKFSHVVKATSHMRAGQEIPAEASGRAENPENSVLSASNAQTVPVQDRPMRGQGPGRPKGGKRSNPAYQQVTALIPGELYTRVRQALLAPKSADDFSDLVKRLLESWLLSQV